MTVGAKPVFADVDSTSQNINVESIRLKLTPRTKAILVVHLAGWSCEMDPILNLAHAKNLAVIEDCAQAHGARYKGPPVGSMGTIGAFSFCQDKKLHHHGGRGWAAGYKRQIPWEKAWAYKDHGKSIEAVYRRQHPIGFRWLHDGFGSNFRMTEVQAAVGRVALRQLDAWVTERRRNAGLWREGLKDLRSLRIPAPPEHIYHSFYKFYIFIEPRLLHVDWSRDRIMQEINARGVPCTVGSCSEIYRERAFLPPGKTPKALPIARSLGLTSLMFLVHPTLSSEDMSFMIGTVRDVISRATC